MKKRYNIKQKTSGATKKACIATMKHCTILANTFGTTNLEMFYLLVAGHYRQELGEIQ